MDTVFPLRLENEAIAAYEEISVVERSTAGGCVAALPSADQFARFLGDAELIWRNGWRKSPARYRHLLLRLYHSIAFLCYEGNGFWESFGQAVGDFEIVGNPNRQAQINEVFGQLARHFRLEIIPDATGARTLYVQSAVRHIGIPVHVWRGFVEVCEHLLTEGGWRDWPAERWEDAMQVWLGGRRNLRKFFAENRQTATDWLQEMIEARLILERNPEWTLDDVAQVSRLRAEYFDEVPETALFLRPIRTETLFRDRPRLRMRWQPGHVELRAETPRIKNESDLPADWLILGRRVRASTNPVSISLHCGAFAPELPLKLVQSEKEIKSWRLRGLEPWGLWSESGGAFISPHVRELPMDAYLLVSSSQLHFVRRDGWLGDDEDERRWNVETEMPDGSLCFVNRLAPDARRAILEVDGWHRIIFAPRARLELRVFPRVADRPFLSFTSPNKIALPGWPHFVVKAPKGLLANSAEETLALLQQDFRFYANDCSVEGSWLFERDVSRHLENEEAFIYRIEKEWLPPSWQPQHTHIFHDFRDLRRGVASVPEACELTIQLRSKHHGVIRFDGLPEIHFKKEPPLAEGLVRKMWIPFPDYWPWYVLTVTQDHATWEEIRLAFDVMNATDVRINYQVFRQIEQLGMMTRRGREWTDFKSRVHFGRHENGTYTVRYAGLTNTLYAVIRRIEPLEKIKIRHERKLPPFLEMRFSLRENTDGRLRDACRREGIEIMNESLWTR